jgi:hypothetical protein
MVYFPSRIYHQDITGSTWLLIQELYREGKYTIMISLDQPGYEYRNYIGKENIPSGYHWINLAINTGII